MFEYHFLLLTTRTYTHVGQGAAESAVIDSLIQREQPYKIPIIYASSLKGAIRDHCEFILGYNKNDSDVLFGSKEPDTSVTNGKTTKTIYQAIVNFFDARLLFLPVGALSKYSFYYATSPYVLKRFTTMYKQIIGKDYQLKLDLPTTIDTFICYAENKNELTPWIEGIQGKYIVMDNEFLNDNLFGIPKKQIALFNDELLFAICRDCIPVLEHNKLDKDGISENKFNEEVLPYDTKMWFIISFPSILNNDKDKNKDNDQENDQEKDKENDKDKNITALINDIQDKFIQIGANASLGQGLCEIQELK